MNRLRTRMPYRNLTTLEAWVAEFSDLGYPIAGSIRVIPQDGDGGADTGLVSVHMMNAQTVTVVQPVAPGSPKWMVTFEERDTALTLDAAHAFQLATELTMVSTLCIFLEAKSRQLDGDDS